MRRSMLFTLLVVLGLFLAGTGNSHASLTFGDNIDFSGSKKDFDGRDYLELGGEGTLFTYSYTHNVTFIPPAASVTSAQVLLSHHNSSDNPGELWFLEESNRTRIGTLSESTGNSWVDQVFVLPASLYSLVNGGAWSLELVLNESSTGTDKLQIDQSVLSGTYVPTPIPAAVWLLGSGLAGLAGINRKNRI